MHSSTPRQHADRAAAAADRARENSDRSGSWDAAQAYQAASGYAQAARWAADAYEASGPDEDAWRSKCAAEAQENCWKAEAAAA